MFYKAIIFAITLIGSLSLQGEIYNLQFTIDGMCCPYCPRAIVNRLKTVPGVREDEMWSFAGLGVAGWKSDVKFDASKLFKAFFQTQFILREMDIDVDGTIETVRGALTLRSSPDDSVFYIDNRSQFDVAKLKNGEHVRLQGFVSGRGGYNYLTVKNVLRDEV